jgi:hypothetical protein
MADLSSPIDGAYLKLWCAKEHMDALWAEVAPTLQFYRENVTFHPNSAGVWVGRTERCANQLFAAEPLNVV